MTQTSCRRAGSAPGLLWTLAWSCSFGQVWGIKGDWLPVLRQKRLCFSHGMWEQDQYKLFSSPNKAAVGWETVVDF